MHRTYSTWKLIADSLLADQPVMLLYVLESRGSSPGRQGFMMAVNSTGAMQGSLGGGIMEHKFVELARTQLSEGTAVPSVHQQVHNKSAARHQSGMICSGEQTIFLYQVNTNDLPAIRSVLQTLERHGNATLQLSMTGIVFREEVPERDYFFEQRGADFLLTEKIGYKNQLYIIGGGHCALAFSRLMRGMDFYIRLYDDREALYTMQQNSFVHEQAVISDYAELARLVEEGPQVYVVVMTFGYRTDAVALKALLRKRFRYLGVLGSASKIRQMSEQFRQEGVTDALPGNIYAPVGIPIKSETPEEIAVSIAAEIIRVKNTGS